MFSHDVSHILLQDNWSALMFAAKNGALEICIELLEAGASLEHRDLVILYCI